MRSSGRAPDYAARSVARDTVRTEAPRFDHLKYLTIQDFAHVALDRLAVDVGHHRLADDCRFELIALCLPNAAGDQFVRDSPAASLKLGNFGAEPAMHVGQIGGRNIVELRGFGSLGRCFRHGSMLVLMVTRGLVSPPPGWAACAEIGTMLR